MLLGRNHRLGMLCGAAVAAGSLLAGTARAFDPPPMGVPGYTAVPAGQAVVGYTVPVAPDKSSAGYRGARSTVVVRNAAPSIPGYVASYTVPVAPVGQPPAVVGYRASYQAPIGYPQVPVYAVRRFTLPPPAPCPAPCAGEVL